MYECLILTEKSEAVLQASLVLKTMKKSPKFTRKDGETEDSTITKSKSNQKSWKKGI